MYNNGKNNSYYGSPPPNLLNEGPIPLAQIRRNGNRIFDMLKGVHKELQYMDGNHVRYDSNDRDWIPVSRKTNEIGRKMEDRLNRGIDAEGIYDNRTGSVMNYNTQMMDYENPEADYNTSVSYSSQAPQNNNLNYKRTLLENEKNMSKVEDLDISEYIGGTSIGDSFDKTVFINMDKTNKAILNSTTKLCKLVGLLIQVEGKNGERLEKILEAVKSRTEEKVAEDEDIDDIDVDYSDIV